MDNGRILLLVFLIAALAIGGVKFSQVVAANLLRANVQTTKSAWVEGAVRSVNVLPMIIEGMVPSKQIDSYFKDASQFGNVYRFRLWDRSGKIVSIAGGVDSRPPDKTRISESIRSGVTSTEIIRGILPANTPYSGV
jgi:hypothetical protein